MAAAAAAAKEEAAENAAASASASASAAAFHKRAGNDGFIVGGNGGGGGGSSRGVSVERCDPTAAAADPAVKAALEDIHASVCVVVDVSPPRPSSLRTRRSLIRCFK